PHTQGWSPRDAHVINVATLEDKTIVQGVRFCDLSCEGFTGLSWSNESILTLFEGGLGRPENRTLMPRSWLYDPRTQALSEVPTPGAPTSPAPEYPIRIRAPRDELWFVTTELDQAGLQREMTSSENAPCDWARFFYPSEGGVRTRCLNAGEF